MVNYLLFSFFSQKLWPIFCIAALTTLLGPLLRKGGERAKDEGWWCRQKERCSRFSHVCVSGFVGYGSQEAKVGCSFRFLWNIS